MNIKFRFTIARKLFLGFGILMLAVTFTSYYTFITLDKSMKINDRINNIYTPSATQINDLLFMVTNTKMLIKIWVHIDKKDDTPDKRKLKAIMDSVHTNITGRLDTLVTQWDSLEQKQYSSICHEIDSLLNEHRSIMGNLSSFDKYEDTGYMFEVIPRVEPDGDLMILTDTIVNKLSALASKHQDRVKLSNAQMEDSFLQFQKLIVLMGVFLFTSVIVIAYVIIHALVSPIRYIKRILLSMSKGILPDKRIKGGNDEIGEISEAVNLLVSGLKQTSEFSIEIGKGNFESSFKPLSDSDLLGNSLIMMRENLKKAQMEADKRKQEDSQRTWASQGLAKFGELLRKNNDDIQEFGYSIISNLVKYLNANQGGIFIINDDDTDNHHIEMVACYAYNRRKYMQKKIEIGTGIVGQCVLEKETIYMTDIPKNYINITSGLGEDNPRALLVIPLIYNDLVMGIVELASFSPFEQYQIQFVEKIGETIAATIQSVKINNNTNKLLLESQEKSERLARQEEEMRKTMEDMREAQEDAQRKDRDRVNRMQREYEDKISQLQSKISDLNSSIDREKLRSQKSE